MSLNLCLFVHSGVQQILCCVLLLSCFVAHPLMYPIQTCLPLPFWRKAHDFWAILRPYGCCQFPYDSANLRYFRKVFGSGPSFHCGSIYYKSHRHFRLLKKRCQNVNILIINQKSI